MTIIFIGPTRTCKDYAKDMGFDNTPPIVTNPVLLDGLKGPVTVYICPGYLALPKWHEIESRLNDMKSGHVKIYVLTSAFHNHI